MKCKNCQEGNVLVPSVVVVTHDMALDAGEPSLEGQPWDWGDEWVACECCHGEWQDCPTCREENRNQSLVDVCNHD